MRNTLTISLPAKLRQSVIRSAKKRKMSTSEFMRSAAQQKLWEDAFDESVRMLQPRARAQGIYTDEDVFKIVS